MRRPALLALGAIAACCFAASVSAQLAGGTVSPPVTSPEIAAAATAVIDYVNTKYCAGGANSGSVLCSPVSQWTLGSVLNATSQVVTGVRYSLLLKAQSAAGAKAVINATVTNRPWVNPPNTVTIVSSTLDTAMEGPASTESPVGCAGCPQPADVEAEDVKAAAAAVVDYVNTKYCAGGANSGSVLCSPVSQWTLGSVLSATSQVTAGTTYKLLLTAQSAEGAKAVINATVTNRPWLNPPNTVTIVSSDLDAATDVPACPGCPQPADVNAEDVKAAAAAVVEYINKEYCDEEATDDTVLCAADVKWTLGSVLSATSQVTAGTTYKLLLTAQSAQGAKAVMNATVVSIPWMDPPYDVTIVTSALDAATEGPASTEGPVGCAGCPHPADVDAEDVKAAAAFAVAYISSPACTDAVVCGGQTWTLVRVLSAKTEPVAGINYILDLEVKSSAGKTITVSVKVFVQSWTQTTAVTELNGVPVSGDAPKPSPTAGPSPRTWRSPPRRSPPRRPPPRRPPPRFVG